MKRLLFALLCFFSMTTINAQTAAKLYRYINTTSGGHFYTTDFNELGNGKSPFKLEAVTGFAYTSQVEGSQPVYRYYDTKTKSHFYTMKWEELGKGKGEFTYEKVAFYAFPTQAPGTVALYRYLNVKDGHHFYTANYSELGEGKDGFKGEGITSYIFPDEASALAAVKKETPATPAPAAAVPVAPITAVTTAAIAAPQVATDYIKLENNTTHRNYQMIWKTAILNQVVAVLDNKNQPLMLLMLPANGGHSPVPGTYTVVDGSKRAVKKGSQTVKLEYEPGYVSAEGGGTITITENDGIFWFTAENVTIVNSKTKETHQISFKMGMFIEKV
ncbi:MAG: hypothetical protein JWP88_505 [Flaviaesturariibacter sp.]|nr:hypothetical protein [Flaviaesturariibacter sp.]